MNFAGTWDEEDFIALENMLAVNRSRECAVCEMEIGATDGTGGGSCGYSF